MKIEPPIPNDMWSSDEDLTLFLEEFGTLLNKYRYAISPFQLRKFKPEIDELVGGFRGEGEGFLAPIYLKKVKNEQY